MGSIARAEDPGPPSVNDDRHDVWARSREDAIVEWYSYPAGPPGHTPSHSHDGYQLSVASGTASTYRYRGEWIVVPPGRLSILMPDEVHSASENYRQERTTYRVLYANPDQLRDVAAEVGGGTGLPYFPHAVLVDDELATHYQRLHAAFDGTSLQLGRDVGLLWALAALVGRHGHKPSSAAAPTGPRQAVRLARSYLEDHYAADVSLDTLARLVALSPFHLARLFQREVGMPPHAYQVQLRISHAKPLLLQGLPISRVATDTGFFDASHFTRHFKRQVGVTPGDYALIRKNVQSGRRSAS